MSSIVLPAQAEQAISAVTEYRFQDRSLLGEAFEAAGSGIRYMGNRTITDGNKRLAIVGDTVLKLVLVMEWFPSGQPRCKPARSTSQCFHSRFVITMPHMLTICNSYCDQFPSDDWVQ